MLISFKFDLQSDFFLLLFLSQFYPAEFKKGRSYSLNSVSKVVIFSTFKIFHHISSHFDSLWLFIILHFSQISITVPGGCY